MGCIFTIAVCEFRAAAGLGQRGAICDGLGFSRQQGNNTCQFLAIQSIAGGCLPNSVGISLPIWGAVVHENHIDARNSLFLTVTRIICLHIEEPIQLWPDDALRIAATAENARESKRKRNSEGGYTENCRCS